MFEEDMVDEQGSTLQGVEPWLFDVKEALATHQLG